MAKVKVRLRAVFGDENFPVLKRAHGARIHVDIGIEFEDRDLELAGFEDGGEGRRKNAFTQRGNHPAGYANVLGHEAPIS